MSELNWLQRIGLWSAPAPPPATEAMPEVTGRIPNTRVNFHIRRFTLALEQCEKGEDRKAVLQANLDYWTAIKAARAMLPEGEG